MFYLTNLKINKLDFIKPIYLFRNKENNCLTFNRIKIKEKR